jgi:hypothetical protein
MFYFKLQAVLSFPAGLFSRKEYKGTPGSALTGGLWRSSYLRQHPKPKGSDSIDLSHIALTQPIEFDQSSLTLLVSWATESRGKRVQQFA